MCAAYRASYKQSGLIVRGRMASTVVLRVLRKLFSRISVICSVGSIGVKVTPLESDPESYVALSLCYQFTEDILPVHLRHDKSWASGEVRKEV